MNYENKHPITDNLVRIRTVVALGWCASVLFDFLDPFAEIAPNGDATFMRTVGYPDGHNYTANLQGIYVDG